MITILVICLLASVALAIACYFVLDNLNGIVESFATIGICLAITAAIAFLIVTPIMACNITAAQSRVELLNKSFGTHYTADEVMYGDDIIKQVIQGSKSRIELTTKKE
jgi:integral membrane sensor domain MASE1